MLDDSDDEYCHRDRAASVESDNSELPVSSSTGSCQVGMDKTSTADHTQLTEQALLTDRIEHKLQDNQRQPEARNQPSVLLHSIAAHSDMNVSDAEVHGRILSPPSFNNSITESDFDAVVPSSCMSVSLSRRSPDSGVYSKAVSNSLVTSMSTVTETLDITMDLLKSTDDKSSGLNVSATLHTEIKNDNFDKSQNSDPELQTVYEPLPACTEVLQSTCLDDVDDQNTTVDVRSSIMSTNTDDEVDQTVVGTGEQILHESSFAVTCEDGQSEVNDVCLPAEPHVLCLGSQEPSGLSDSDAEDEAVLKTVVAVRTKALHDTECVDSIQPFEPEKKSDSDELQNSSLGLGKINIESMEEQASCGDLNVDNSLTVCSNLQCVNASSGSVNDLQTAHSDADTGGNGVPMDRVNDVNPVTVVAEISRSTNERQSTLSTELDQYMSQCAPRAMDTSFDSQVLDSRQITDLIASVKIFSEDEDLRNDFAGRRSRTRSFTKADYSVPSSQSSSPEIPSSTEIRRHSCTVSSPQPLDVLEQVCKLSLEYQCREIGRDSENATTAPRIPLSASIEDLKLRPSKKKLEFDGPPGASTPMFVLEPPDEYRDQPMSTEDVRSFGSSVSPNVTDLCTDACRPPVGLNMQAKKDHLERYLKSLAAMPGCESAHEDSGWLQSSQDNNYACRFHGECAIDLQCQERSTPLLMPDLLHQSDNIDELNDDECLELQLQQYEVMKQRLMEEHRRSLEQLLAEQERQMSLLQSRLMGHSLYSTSSHHTGTAAHVSSTSAMPLSDFEHCKSKPLPLDVPDTFHRQMQSTSHTAVDLDQQNVSKPDQHVEALVVGKMSSGHKMRSPAGVFYMAQQVVSREPSCSTIRSDDTDSEFAYKSPAVLRSSRRLTPTCSPRNSDKMQVDSSLHSLMPTEDTYPYSSAGPERSPVYARRLDRRYVDIFSEASL